MLKVKRPVAIGFIPIWRLIFCLRVNNYIYVK
jgi:hypothetical protein